MYKSTRGYEKLVSSSYAIINGLAEDKDYYEYLEFNFYMFTKDSKYIISNISKEYEGVTFNKLLREGVVDDSYIVTIIVCKNCGVYSVVIEEFEI